MNRCERWRHDYLPGLRSDGRVCAVRPFAFAHLGPYRLFAVGSRPARLTLLCGSPWLTVGHNRDTLYLSGLPSDAVTAFARERVGPGGFPLGGPKRRAQLVALARSEGAHVFEYEYTGPLAGDGGVWDSVRMARALVAAVALWVGAHVPGLIEGPDGCPSGTGWCAWGGGCCPPHEEVLGDERVRLALDRDRHWTLYAEMNERAVWA